MSLSHRGAGGRTDADSDVDPWELVWVQDATWEGALSPDGRDRLWSTADAGLGWRWRQEGRPWNSPWSLVSLGDQLELADEALALADGWLAGNAELNFRGQNLAELCRTAALYLFRDALLAGRLAERLLDHHRPGTVTVAGDDVMAGVLHWEAERRGLPVRKVAYSVPEGAARTSPSGVRDWRVLLDRAAAAAAIAGQWRAWRPPATRSSAVLFAGGGVDFLNQMRIVEGLRAKGSLPVVHVALHPPEMAGQTAAASRPSPDLVLPPFVSLTDWREARALGRRAWAAFQRGEITAAGHRELFTNQRLWPEFRRLFLETVPHAGGAYGAALRLLERTRPGVVVLSNAASPRERALLAAAGERGVPSVQLVHSGINDLHVHRVMADHFWVWGPSHAQQFTGVGVAPERISVVGNPSYDDPEPAVMRQSLGVGGDEVVFLLVTARPARLLAFLDPEQHAADLKSICEALAGVGARLIVRPHPRYDDVAAYRELAERWPGLIVVETGTLRSLLPACDVAIVLNVATTGGLEAVLAGKPLVWCRTSSRYPAGFDLLESVALTLTEREAIGPALVRLAQSAAFRDEVAARGHRYSAEVMVRPHAGATNAAIAALEELVAAGRADSTSSDRTHRTTT